ncbi:Alpha/Beta hydrolase protein [Peziza echinospora]|nr:Alpha/Beta hydrolase protein [Peziza echinospora]
MPLTVSEVLAHPGFTNVISLPEPDRKGIAIVAKDPDRGGNKGKAGFGISWEIYGRGPVLVVWIMGLNGPKVAWHRQTKYFGVEQGDIYSCLVFDNRGVGDSDAPLMQYSTSEMAKDVLELIEHVGWSKERRIHLVGVSMGGMIAQELALLAPTLLASLTLQSTAARLSNVVSWPEHIYSRLSLLIPRSFPSRVHAIQTSLFSPHWLASPDDLNNEFPTNADRHMAEELWRSYNLPKPRFHGFLLQAIAAAWHSVDKDRLAELAGTGTPKPILVLTGTEDRMIQEKHSVEICEGVNVGGEGRARLVRFEGAAHVLGWERRREYNVLVEQLFRESEVALGRGEVFGL